MSVMKRIMEVIEYKGIQQKDVCEALGINSSTFSTWKKRYGNIPIDKLVAIADYLKVPVLYLLTGQGEKEKREMTEQENELLRIYNVLSLKDKSTLLIRA